MPARPTTYVPPGGGRSPIPHTAWGQTPQIPNNHPSLYNGTYNIPTPTGNPTYSMVDPAGFNIQQNSGGQWQRQQEPLYPTGWNTGRQPFPPTSSQNPPENSPYGMRLPGRNTAAAGGRASDTFRGFNELHYGSLGRGMSGGPRTLADQARQTVQNTVHNPSQQMYAGLPGLAQMATGSDMAANNTIGSQWQDTARKRNLQNMNVTLSTMPIEQQLQRYGLVAQSGVQHADMMRRMADLRENWGLSRMNQGLQAARAIYS